MSKLNVLALMFLQEVGFDVVSLWNQMGYGAKGLALLLALVAASIVVFVILKLLPPRDSH
jgi:hypothetical protein